MAGLLCCAFGSGIGASRFRDCVVHTALQAGSVTGAAEKGWQASLRMTLCGTKTMAACSIDTAVSTFGTLDPTTLWQKLLEMKVAEVEKMVDLQRPGCPPKLWVGTVGPKELFYLPAGWLFTESVLPSTDDLGILARKLLHIASKNDSDLEVLVRALDSDATLNEKHKSVQPVSAGGTHGNEGIDVGGSAKEEQAAPSPMKTKELQAQAAQGVTVPVGQISE